MSKTMKFGAAALVLALGSACSNDYGFQALQQCEGDLVVEEGIVTRQLQPLDALFVIDNSFSMEDNQDALAQAFDGFASRYLSSRFDVDIRLASITTDTYLAYSRNASGELTYPAQYAMLLPGVMHNGYNIAHDGIRPVNEETVLPVGYRRTGKPILSALIKDGRIANGSLSSLVADFKTNVRAGVSGSGYESGLESIRRFLKFNENSAECWGETPAAHCFFRKNSLRAIYLLTDSVDTCVPDRDEKVCRHGSVRAAAIKQELDNYFTGLNGSQAAGGSGDPRYFVTAAVSDSVDMDNCEALSLADCAKTIYANYSGLIDPLKADETNSLAKHSTKLDIGLAANIGNSLDRIGLVLEEQSRKVNSTFTLKFIPESKESLKFHVVKPDGTKTSLPAEHFVLTGKTITIDQEFLSQDFPMGSKLEGCYLPDVSKL